jgi:hypothetical protein
MADEAQAGAPGADDVAEAARALGLGSAPPDPGPPPGGPDEWRDAASTGGQSTEAPETDPASPEEAGEPDDDYRLSPAEAAVALSRPEEWAAYQEELAEEAAYADEVEALQSGEAVESVVMSQQAYNGAIEQLARENPGITSPEAIAAMERPFETMRELYGEEIAMSPECIRQVYNQVGGEERFGQDPETARYAHALSRGGSKISRFGF